MMIVMMPGVRVPPERRKQKQHHKESSSSLGESSLTERREPLVTDNSHLDETAISARQRLEQTLGYSYPSSRSSELPAIKSRDRNNKSGTKNSCLASKLFGSRWHLKLKRCKSYRKVCSICLENLKAGQEVTKLSCSHKYHSNCLLPWLAVHPHCPYCRTPILLS